MAGIYTGITLGVLDPRSGTEPYITEEGNFLPHGDRIRVTVLTTSDHEKLFRNHDPKRFVYAWDRDKEENPSQFPTLLLPGVGLADQTRLGLFAQTVAEIVIDEQAHYLPDYVKLVLIVEAVSPLAKENDRDHLGWQIGVFVAPCENGKVVTL